jgi:16S rRNA (cytosine967-C5)-methyltransferase
MINDPRKTALLILNELDKNRKTLDAVLEDISAQLQLLSKRDRSLVYALVYGVLRWRGRLDRIISHFSKSPLNKIDRRVLNILRIGLFQIIYLDRIPVSAAVNTSVEISKSFAAPWIVRFINGLLRNAARKYETVPFPDIHKDPAASLAAEKSFPKWLIQRWLEQFGHDETRQFCDAVNAIPSITVRANTLKTSREQLRQSLEHDAEYIEFTAYSPEGISFSSPRIPIPEMEAFKAGWFQVQDEAAQLVTHLLNPRPGERILDACAGLGGKTAHIAQLMENQGQIVATDTDEQKLLRLRSEMERLGISIVETRPHDISTRLDKKISRGFDRILLDAPCSGLGVLRRNPDTKWSVSKKNLLRYQKRQITFLDNLAPLVAASGILVYAVCSTEPEENEAVINDFLSRHPEFEIEAPNSSIQQLVSSNRQSVSSIRHPASGIRHPASSIQHPASSIQHPAPSIQHPAPSTQHPATCLKTLPHIHNMDGFFSVRFRRITGRT